MSTKTSIAGVNIPSFIASVGKRLARCGCLEDAAQKVTELVHAEFKDSVVLARLFATVPFEMLPSDNRNYVVSMMNTKGLVPMLHSRTPILSLLGSSGQEDDWNNRRKSQGHVGIPFVSSDFIDQVPMISHMLKSLGFSMDAILGNGTGITQTTMGKMAGIFYVPDAATAVDEKQRKIISAQDFVSKYNIKTVFGIGGGYMQESTFIVLIVFAREHIDEERARCFLPLSTAIKAATTKLVLQQKIFKS
jgi:hypothetical protein